MTIERHQKITMNGRDLFSNVVTSDRRRMIFISGQLAVDARGQLVGEGDMGAQLRQVCENIKAALAAVGATTDDLVQTTTFVTDWAAFGREAIALRPDYLGLPTSTTVQVAGLARPGFMIEISAIAMVDA